TWQLLAWLPAGRHLRPTRHGFFSAGTVVVEPSHVAKAVSLDGKPDLRERALCGGVQGLSDLELLAIVLGTGAGSLSASAISAALLGAAGGLEGILRFGPHGLAAQRGVGPAKAARVSAALELGQRAALRLLGHHRPVMSRFETVADWARPRLAGLEHEEVWLLALDGRNGLKSARRIAQGGQHGCALTPRDVLAPALRDAASAILLVHNHPSGDPAPSDEDVAMTRAVAAACDVVGVPLLDHLVVARGGASSVFERSAQS
ncbi:MAG TPA: DNA repair protein RadC, partial [Polyangiaceae bacterium]